tara:strand:- start:20988 stop:21425 length:438 start_codon:yes stop_codon:yes gene_type:complete
MLQKGFSLVEILVSVLIFSIGLLGLAAMQLNALKFNQGASERSHAVFLAYEMADRMRAGRGDVAAGFYDLSLDGELSCVPDSTNSGGCKPFQRDLAEWRANLSAQLTNGTGSISRNGGQVTITVQWDESRVGDSETQQFSFVTRM